MSVDNAGRFRNCWMFDTYDAIYHLDDTKTIIWIECERFHDKLIGISSKNTVKWHIWNPGVFVLQEANEDDQIKQILEELTDTYSERISFWLDSRPEINIAA